MNNLKLYAFAILGMIILMITNGFTLTGITIFDESLLTEFDWKVSELKFRDFINLVTAAALMPFIGALIDRFGVKRAILFGLTLLSICYYLYSFTDDLLDVYLLHIGFALVVSAAGTLSIIIMVSERVKEKRGLAIGIAIAGTSLGGMVIPQLGTRLLENYPWRSVFQYEAILPLILMVLVFLFLKDINKEAVSDTVEEEDKAESKEVSFTFREALRTPTFWAVGFAGFLSYYCILAIISNLFLFLRSLDFDAVAAGNAMSVFFAVMLGTKFLSGFLTDYVSQFKLFKIQLAIMLMGAIGLSMGNPSTAYLFLIIIGLGWGGMYTLFNYIIIEAFGLGAAGKIGGTISTLESIGGGLGIWMTGILFDAYGSYSVAFGVVALFVGLSLLLSFLIKPVSKEQEMEKSVVG